MFNKEKVISLCILTWMKYKLLISKTKNWKALSLTAGIIITYDY